MFGQVNAEYRERAMSEEADTASLVVVAEKKRQHSALYSNTPSPERAREGVENKKQKTADLVSVAMETDERAREQKESDLDYACAAKDVNAAQKKAANKPKTKNSVEEKDFSKLSVKALKEKCKEKGLLLKGKKEDLIERLKNPLEHLQNCLGKRGTTTDQVDAALRFFGIKAPTKTAKCAREAIRNGSLKISDGGLDKTIFTGTCEDGCGKTLTCTLRDLLYQKDSGEDDYDNGAQGGALQCDGDCEYGYYVTNACYGQMRQDSGKQHDHCGKCKGFGKCTNDCRNLHCNKCGEHYFAGTGQRFSCPCKERRGGRRGNGGCNQM